MFNFRRKEIKEYFVFGSNEAGRHGGGAALYAVKNHGAIYGEWFGIQGSAFAIPTKDHNIETLDMVTIAMYVNKFKEYAINNPDKIFNVTSIGTGLAGIEVSDIAPLFSFEVMPENVHISELFQNELYGRIVRPERTSFDINDTPFDKTITI